MNSTIIKFVFVYIENMWGDKMKENNICSKCNSKKVVEVEYGAGLYHIPISKFKVVTTYRRVCCECGYI